MPPLPIWSKQRMILMTYSDNGGNLCQPGGHGGEIGRHLLVSGLVDFVLDLVVGGSWKLHLIAFGHGVDSDSSGAKASSTGAFQAGLTSGRCSHSMDGVGTRTCTEEDQASVLSIQNKWGFDERKKQAKGIICLFPWLNKISFSLPITYSFEINIKVLRLIFSAIHCDPLQ